MTSLQIRCLGDFEVRREGRAVTGFESHKVRALLAYLVCQRDRAFSREHLAALLWPDRRAEAARRNLRQAIYNLKSALGGSPFETSPAQLKIADDFELWLDVTAFEGAMRHVDPTQTMDTHRLAGAVRLYRGEFLSGFPLRDSSAFEDWLLTERERLREGIAAALRSLIESYLARGELRVGLQYARRLVALDPLSEEAHRYLMQLFAYSGRRRRALAQYQELEALLQRELGVDPLAETRQLYEAILTEKSPFLLARDDSEPIGPLVPLVGRARDYGRLTRVWRELMKSGQSQVALIEGEPGVGKSRLARAFLDAASAQAGLVLVGSCQERVRIPLEPFPGLLRSAFSEGSERLERILATIRPSLLADLALLVPELREQRPDLPAAEPLPTLERLAAAITTLFRRLLEPERAGARPAPLILFLDDLHLARLESYELLTTVLESFAGEPLWLLATGEPLRLEIDNPFRGFLEQHEDRVQRLALERLTSAQSEEISAWLMGSKHDLMTRLLDRHGEGLPLQIVELVNFLWDDGVLVPGEEGHWRLRDGAGSRLPETVDLDVLMSLRLRRLPSSARRLAVLAAVIGQPFRAQLLATAAEEHDAVVEVALEILLERWIVRQYVDHWTTGETAARHPQSGAAANAALDPYGGMRVGSSGVRRSSFTFVHPRARDAIYQIVSEDRRRFIHNQVSDALLELYQGDPERACEQLAYHLGIAKRWREALVYLNHAAEKAHAVHAWQTAAYYDRQCLDALDRLIEQGSDDGEEIDRWRLQRARIARRQPTRAGAV